MKRIGDHFHKELLAAGLAGLPFSWNPDGLVLFDEKFPEDQRDAVMQVFEAHDPDAPPPKDYAQLRREAYVAAGVTIEAIAEALIEHAGGKSQKLLQLMQLRDAVRAEIPKP
jgi:hypothetical protein